MNKARGLSAITLLFFLSIQTSYPGNATWNPNPSSGDWNTATNWTPAIVPNGPNSTAAFAVSDTTSVSLSANTEVSSIVFNQDASPFTITASPISNLTMSGAGILNNSANVHNFVSVVDATGQGGTINFTNNASAGRLTSFANNGSGVGGTNGGFVFFHNNSDASSASFTNKGGNVAAANGGVTFFDGNASAANGTFTIDGGTVKDANGGYTIFFTKANAGNGTFTINSGAVSEAFGGTCYFGGNASAGTATFTNDGGIEHLARGGTTEFHQSSDAGNSTLIGRIAGTGVGFGGSIVFWDDSRGGNARVMVFDQGYLHIGHHNPPGLTIGSLEGHGVVFIGSNNLVVGTNGLDTRFQGVVKDGGAGGTFTKIGNGTLTLEGGTGNYFDDTITLILNGFIDLNYTGNPDTVAGLIVDGVAQPPGIYGSDTSGAPHPVPFFRGTGTIEVVVPAVQLPAITSPSTAIGTVGQSFVYQFEATDGTTLDVTNPPPGLTFDPALRAIVGTPTDLGTFQVGLTAANSRGSTNTILTITVQPAPTSGPIIASGSAATGRVGRPFLFRVYTIGGTPSATLSVTGLPPGLRTDEVPGVTGLISGTPTQEGSFAVTLTVTDGPFTVTSTLQLTFTANDERPVIVSPTLVSLTPGQFFFYRINALPVVASYDPPVFSYIGNLPAGLLFNAANGTISGTYAVPRANNQRGADAPDLTGGTLLGSIQLFATNGQGTSTMPLTFLRPTSGVVNISTRLPIGTGENVLIGGFIIQGNAPKIVILRGIGPSTGIPEALQDPTLELHDSSNNVVFNDDWRQTQQDIIIATTIPPQSDRESAIVLGLDPGFYTAIVAGKDATTGIGLVEAYDLGTASLDLSGVARLAEISTRGFVDIGNDVIIGGFINRDQTTNVIVRAIGPSLAGVANALADPTLELRDGNGSVLIANDNWQDDSGQAGQLMAAGLAPTNPLESGIAATLPAGPYTAVIRGNSDTTGVGLVEVYALN